MVLGQRDVETECAPRKPFASAYHNKIPALRAARRTCVCVCEAACRQRRLSVFCFPLLGLVHAPIRIALVFEKGATLGIRTKRLSKRGGNPKCVGVA